MTLIRDSYGNGRLNPFGFSKSINPMEGGGSTPIPSITLVYYDITKVNMILSKSSFTQLQVNSLSKIIKL